MEMYQHSLEDMTASGNIVKDAVIDALRKEGVITDEKAEEWFFGYFVTAHKPSRLTQFWKKVFGIEDDKNEIVWMVSKRIV